MKAKSKETKDEKKTTLYDKIEKIVDKEGCTFLEAISRYAEDNKITQNKVAKMLCQRLQAQIEIEVRGGRMVQVEVLNKFDSKRKKNGKERQTKN